MYGMIDSVNEIIDRFYGFSNNVGSLINHMKNNNMNISNNINNNKIIFKEINNNNPF